MKEYTLKGCGVKLRYHDLPGDDIPIVFIHGLGCSSSFEYPQVASMKEVCLHRRLLIDLIGAGFSDKPDNFSYEINSHAAYLEDFINHLDIDSLYIYGHSRGGSIAINLATRLGNRVKGLIIAEANLDSGGGFFSRKIAFYSEQDYLNRGHDEIIQENLEASNDSWVATLSSCNPIAVSREAKSLVQGETPSWRAQLYSLRTDKTFLFGEYSLPDPDLEKLKIENISIEVVPKAGHSMAIHNPEGVAKAIGKAIACSR